MVRFRPRQALGLPRSHACPRCFAAVLVALLLEKCHRRACPAGAVFKNQQASSARNALPADLPQASRSVATRRFVATTGCRTALQRGKPAGGGGGRERRSSACNSPCFGEHGHGEVPSQLKSRTIPGRIQRRKTRRRIGKPVRRKWQGIPKKYLTNSE